MTNARRGREFYSKNYGKAMELYAGGTEISEIARHLNISYSAVYHWVRGIRKPDEGNINAFESFLRQNGPQASAEIEATFPKHNEIFHTATSRGLQLKRHVLEKKFGGYATWYFLPGQEGALKERVSELFAKYKEMRAKLAQSLASI